MGEEMVRKIPKTVKISSHTEAQINKMIDFLNSDEERRIIKKATAGDVVILAIEHYYRSLVEQGKISGE